MPPNRLKRVGTAEKFVFFVSFYKVLVKRDFEWVGFYKDAVKVSRKIKPEIPEFGNDKIPIKHEIEFEYRLD